MIFVLVLGVSMAVIAALFYRSERQAELRTIRSKIAVLRQKQFRLHREEIQNLSEENISSLRIYKVIILSIVVAVGLIVVGVVAIMSMREFLKLIAGGGVVLMAFVIVLAINKRMNRIVRDGTKTIIRGVITEKNIAVGDKHDKAHHWLYIGDRKVKVEDGIYSQYDIGNGVEFHVFDHFGTVILHHQKLEGAGIDAHDLNPSPHQ